jgi:hypothetical protein
MPPPKPVPNVTIDKQVAVVIDESRNAEQVLQHWPERNAAAESREVAQVSDDAFRVIRRTREGEADGRRQYWAHFSDARESFYDICQALVEVVAVGGHYDSFGHGFAAAHRRETETSPPGIERHDNSFVACQVHMDSPLSRIGIAAIQSGRYGNRYRYRYRFFMFRIDSRKADSDSVMHRPPFVKPFVAAVLLLEKAAADIQSRPRAQ